MKLVISIDCNNEAFNGQDWGTEIGNFLTRIMRTMEFEPKKRLPFTGVRSLESGDFDFRLSDWK